ncbi:hypothetical protein EV715DRAFT_287227 [Schizophyllum commune]
MEGAGKRKRADAGSPSTPSSTGMQEERKRSRRERRPSARFLERDVGNRGAFQRGGKRASKKPNASSKNASTTVDDLLHRENDSASSTKPKVVSPKVIEYINISDDEDVPPPTQRTPQASTSRTQIECIEIDDSDAEGSSYPLSPTSAPMTPGNMSSRDVPCSLRSEAQPPRPPDAVTTPSPTPSGTTNTAAAPSTSSSSQSSSTAPPRFNKHIADALAMTIDEQPSQFLRDVQSLINKRRSQNPARQVAIRVQYHDFSSRTAHPPPLFQSWVDRLVKKSGS